MDPLIRIVVVAIFLAIIASLASALFHLTKGGASDKLVRALTVRIGLSVGLFVLLMAAWAAGFITPHGIGR